MKRRTLRNIVLSGLVGLVAVAGCSKKDDAPRDHKEYRGTIEGYAVRIEEDLVKEQKVKKFVYIEAIDEKKTVPCSVTGHDYNADGEWDRIFIRSREINGYNSVVFMEDGKTKFEPCGADKDRVKMFSPEEMQQARALLKKADTAVYNEKSVVRNYSDSRPAGEGK
jgi:hypothetical protein